MDKLNKELGLIDEDLRKVEVSKWPDFYRRYLGGGGILSVRGGGGGVGTSCAGSLWAGPVQEESRQVL